MGQIITIVGNTGVGKTTFARLLAERGGFALGLEQHIERPFQAKFAAALKSCSQPNFALPNQVDYLTLRAGQELDLRRRPETGVVDGGLDLDYHLFTRRFYQKGYLGLDELDLCRRVYQTYRSLLGPPDWFIWLRASAETAAARYAKRSRPVEIAAIEDLEAMQALLEGWLETLKPDRLIKVDAEGDEEMFEMEVEKLLTAPLGVYSPPPA